MEHLNDTFNALMSQELGCISHAIMLDNHEATAVVATYIPPSCLDIFLAK